MVEQKKCAACGKRLKRGVVTESIEVAGVTFTAELPADVKNRLSHRALAAQQMLVLMRDAWHLPVTA